MIAFYGLLIALLIFFYWILGKLLLKIFTDERKQLFIKSNYFMIWFLLVFIVSLIFQVSYQLPHGEASLGLSDYLILFILIIPFMINSHYKPHQSMKGFIAFCLIFPMGEELVFRGIIPLILNQHFASGSVMVPFPILKEISLTVLISSILFALMHLQYFQFKLSRDTISKMIYAFIFGIVFGNIAEITQSLFYPVLFHIMANIGATYFYVKRLNKVNIKIN